MEDHALSLLPARRVVEGEVFKPVVGEHTGFLGITIRVDIVPSIDAEFTVVEPTARIRCTGTVFRNAGAA